MTTDIGYEIRLSVWAFGRDGAISAMERAWEDAKKTNFEDANTGIVSWGSGLQSTLEMGTVADLKEIAFRKRAREAAEVGL